MLIEIEAVHTGRPLPDMIAEVEGYGYRGMALIGDKLVPLTDIDLDRDQSHVDKSDYLFNFVFYPT